VDCRELLEGGGGAELGHSLKSKFTGIAAGVKNAVDCDFENIFALDDEGYKILFWRGNRRGGCHYALPWLNS
jgi:hypothetical protein